MKINNSLTFLLPLLSNGIYDKRFLINNRFIGCFIGDVNKYSYDYEILLIYKKEFTLEFFKHDNLLLNHPLFSKITYDYSDENITVYVFKIPIAEEEDYDFINYGNHNQIHPHNKLKIIKFWGLNNKLKKYLLTPKDLNDNYISDYEDEFFDINTL